MIKKAIADLKTSLDFYNHNKVFTRTSKGLKVEFDIIFEHVEYSKNDTIPIEKTILIGRDGKEHHLYNDLEKYFFTIRTEPNGQFRFVGYALD